MRAGRCGRQTSAGGSSIRCATCSVPRSETRVRWSWRATVPASILGEVSRGVARGCRHAIFLAVGTGIGAGILVDGEILRGAHDIAGAIGWMGLDRPYRRSMVVAEDSSHTRRAPGSRAWRGNCSTRSPPIGGLRASRRSRSRPTRSSPRTRRGQPGGAGGGQRSRVLGNGGGQPGQPVRPGDRGAGRRRVRAGGRATGSNRRGGPAVGAADQFRESEGVRQHAGPRSMPVRDRRVGLAGGAEGVPGDKSSRGVRRGLSGDAALRGHADDLGRGAAAA